ncbi:MAG: AbrB/MazE/SpoVT family DNA-binding domain-containing protein [Verrucomicrobia bacterium]|nr:AbrB/MazE/SpoVT family DNA-binding domain-containing protein [Verrucomicrobiota bacterium]
MTTTLTGKNQVTVPAELAQKLGLQPGAQFDWALGDRPNRIVITIKPTRKQLLARVRAIGRAFKNEGQDPVGDLVREREEDERLRGETLR